MRKLLLILTLFFVSFVGYSQVNIGKTFQQVLKNKFVTRVDTSTDIKYIVLTPKPTILIINFFDNKNIVYLASVSYLYERDTKNIILYLNKMFVQCDRNMWTISNNVIAKFDEGSFYYFLLENKKLSTF